MNVEIWSDIACPWCAVGKRRFERALEQFEHAEDVTVTFRSFELDPDAPAAREGSTAENLARKYGTSLEQAQAMNQRMTETAAEDGLTFRFDGVKSAEGPNFKADQGTLTVLKNDVVVATLNPQKRQYSRGTQVQTESAIDPGLFRDIYVALGEPIGTDGAWAVRIYIKPFVRWIWLGALFMMLGGFVAATDRRFRALPGRVAADDKVRSANAAGAAA